MKNKFIVIFLYLLTLNLYAGGTNHLLNFIKNVDWEFMGDKSYFTVDLCSCDISNGGRGAGMKARIAEPIGMIETTNTPWNVVSIGQKFDKSPLRKQGSSRDKGKNRRYTHFIAFAPLGMLNFVSDYVCFERLTSTAFLYWSEIIPSQTNDVMALYTQISKGVLSKSFYNNPFGALACIVDCGAATFDEPMNSLHWCAGCAGTTGNNSAYGNGRASDPVMGHVAHALAALDDLHYGGALAKVSNANFTYSPTSKILNSMCRPVYFPIAIKTQYFLQMVYPSTWDAQPIGTFRTNFADFRNRPGAEDDVATWVWSIKDTCAGGAKCKSMFTKEVN